MPNAYLIDVGTVVITVAWYCSKKRNIRTKDS